jgi:hypothetical protein
MRLPADLVALLDDLADFSGVSRDEYIAQLLQQARPVLERARMTIRELNKLPAAAARAAARDMVAELPRLDHIERQTATAGDVMLRRVHRVKFDTRR